MHVQVFHEHQMFGAILTNRVPPTLVGGCQALPSLVLLYHQLHL